MPMTWTRLLNPERPRKTTSRGDHRNEFERDWDRIVFSTPVKRMQDKTQVFPLEPHDAVRTRLTHSLEVSSVARGLATAVGRRLLESKVIAPGTERQLEAIAAACGMVHDLGHPPFGHAGEEAIREWFSERGERWLSKLLEGNRQYISDFLSFESNAQTLRLVAKLQILADFNGLNLTYGTLSALCKYTAASHEAGKGRHHARAKPGFFASEAPLVRQIREATGTGDARNPLAFLVEAADDIVFSAADIEDAVKKGVLQWEFLEEQLKATGNAAILQALENMRRILEADKGGIPSDLQGDVYASAFRTAAIGIMVTSVVETFERRYPDIMSGTYPRELLEDGTSASLVSLLKEIGTKHVYVTQPNLKLELMGRSVIKGLLSIFWEGAERVPIDAPPKPSDFPGRVGALLSENYLRVFRHSVASMPELPQAYHRLQLMTDYVCGMTDSFAKRLHRELVNG